MKNIFIIGFFTASIIFGLMFFFKKNVPKNPDIKNSINPTNEPKNQEDLNNWIDPAENNLF